MSNAGRKLVQFLAVGWRGILGAGAGAVLASIALLLMGDIIFSYYPPDDGFGLLYWVAGLGAILGTAAGMIGGAWEIRGIFKHIIVGVLVGSLFGLFAGMAFGTLEAWRELGGAVDPKIMAGITYWAILLGLPAGSVLGGVVGLAGFLLNKGKIQPSDPTG